jgi:hypothetical protein
MGDFLMKGERMKKVFLEHSRIWFIVTGFLSICAVATAIVLTRPGRVLAVGDSDTTYYATVKMQTWNECSSFAAAGYAIDVWFEWTNSNDYMVTHSVTVTAPSSSPYTVDVSYTPNDVKIGSTVSLKANTASLAPFHNYTGYCGGQNACVYADTPIIKTWTQGTGTAGATITLQVDKKAYCYSVQWKSGTNCSNANCPSHAWYYFWTDSNNTSHSAWNTRGSGGSAYQSYSYAPWDVKNGTNVTLWMYTVDNHAFDNECGNDWEPNALILVKTWAKDDSGEDPNTALNVYVEDYIWTPG